MTSKPQDRTPVSGDLSQSAAAESDLPTSSTGPDALQHALRDIRCALERQENASARHYDDLQATLSGLTEQLDGLAERLLGTTPLSSAPVIRQPAAPVTPEADAGDRNAGDWDSVLLGPELAAQSELDLDRQELLADARHGEPAACGLLGQLLVFRAAGTDRLPVLLKDIGEAYYRWRSSGDDYDIFRDRLILWLQQTCAAAGLSNTIELVHVGDRYESIRHNARERGVEVATVFGWVVLRDNGKVYTKANVAVK